MNIKKVAGRFFEIVFFTINIGLEFVPITAVELFYDLPAMYYYEYYHVSTTRHDN